MANPLKPEILSIQYESPDAKQPFHACYVGLEARPQDDLDRNWEDVLNAWEDLWQKGTFTDAHGQVIRPRYAKLQKRGKFNGRVVLQAIEAKAPVYSGAFGTLKREEYLGEFWIGHTDPASSIEPNLDVVGGKSVAELKAEHSEGPVTLTDIP